MEKVGICDLGFAKIDLERLSRRGFSEAIYCTGKTREQLKNICLGLSKNKQDLLLTRLEKKTYRYLKRSFKQLKYNPTARIGYTHKLKKGRGKGSVLVVTAGTSDMPVAEEAVLTLRLMGSRCEVLCDVGVAGVHRLLRNLKTLKKAKVIVVVAGMEGALASLVSGLVKCPVIAVPTSCGYGASFKGLAALLAMLNSCSPGVAVVNIDNGFGAGYFAALINK
ncbi:nickel pincer cofactor biosynthesis protein LarB [Candidatus Omnitrophota bacterium]